jgi:hypothetical protein
VHIACGDDLVAAQVVVEHFMQRVGDEIFRHTVVQEESMCTQIFKVAVEIFHAVFGADEGCGTKKTDTSKHNVKQRWPSMLYLQHMFAKYFIYIFT